MSENNYLFTNVKNGPEEIIVALKVMGCTDVIYVPTDDPCLVEVQLSYQFEKIKLNLRFNESILGGVPMNMICVDAEDTSIIINKLAQVFGGFVQELFSEAITAYETPGIGDLRWCLDRYYAESISTPKKTADDLDNFLIWFDSKKYLKQA